jgi:hypothetical protein
MSATGEGVPVVRLVNLIPHRVNIRVGEVEVELPAADAPARLTGEVEDVGAIRSEGLDVPVITHRFASIEGLPATQEGVLHVVSQLVLDFVTGRTDLVTPAELIRDDEGNVIACAALARRAG